MDHMIYRLSLDMHRDSSGVTLHAKRRDTARQILITLTDGGVPYTISPGCFAMLTARSPAGLLEPMECAIEGNTVVCSIGTALTAVDGEVACELRLYDRPENGEAMLITSPRFTLSVSQPVQDGTEEEELLQPQQNALDILISNGNAVVQDAQATAQALRDARERGEFDGADGKDGVDGKDGKDGIDGTDGRDGYTPVKGLDYYTEAEKQEFQAALESRTAQNFAATAILCTARGDGSLTVTDGTDYPVQGLKLYGRGNGGDTLRLYIPQQCAAAAVLRHPSDVTATAGSEVKFSIVPGGKDVSCKWEYSTTGGGDWYTSSFPGFNTPEMTVAVTAARNGFMYRCMITDANGNVAFSQPGTLTVGSSLRYTPAVWSDDAAVLTVQLPQTLAGTASDTGSYTDTAGQTWQSAVADLVAGSFTPWGGAQLALDADLSALRCHKGPFTLLNDLDAGMELCYVADAKTYIDQKFAALAAAML